LLLLVVGQVETVVDLEAVAVLVVFALVQD
jgi:hypothetical protein